LLDTKCISLFATLRCDAWPISHCCLFLFGCIARRDDNADISAAPSPEHWTEQAISCHRSMKYWAGGKSNTIKQWNSTLNRKSQT